MSKRKYILFILFLLPCLFLNSQPIDSLVIKLNTRFLKYSETKNSKELYSIGYGLPWGIHIMNNEMTKKDFSRIRNQRTELYFNWILKMLDAGLDVNYNPADPKNTVFRFSGSAEPNNHILQEWKKKNDIKRIKAKKYHVYTRIMNRFQCYYKFAFIEHEKDINTLEELLNAYALEKQLSESIKQKIFVEFKRELEKHTCGF